MKKVTVFVASARKRHTHNAVHQFLDSLQSLGEIESEIVVLSDYDVKTCRGCRVCFDKGHEHCPLKDDRDALVEKMMASDGVVFASPVYSFQVTAFMKIFLDRLGFACHRPRFFGKTCTSIIVEAIYGGKNSIEDLDLMSAAIGFDVVNGCRVQSLEPMTEKQERANAQILAAQSRKFYDRLSRPSPPVPTFFHLMMFRMGRTKIRTMLDETWRDYTYYRDRGWFESDYFYPVRLNLLKKAAGRVFDYAVARSARA